MLGTSHTVMDELSKKFNNDANEVPSLILLEESQKINLIPRISKGWCNSIAITYDILENIGGTGNKFTDIHKPKQDRPTKRW